MKTKLTDDLRDIMSQGVTWAKLQIEYYKLTAAEKLIIILSVMVLGVISLVLLVPVILMLMFALAQVFIQFMPVAVAYVSVAGIVLLLLAIVFLLRKPLIMNPLARFISKVLLDSPERRKSK